MNAIRKDYVVKVSMENVDSLLRVAIGQGMDFYSAEGVLNDFYIVVNDPKIITINQAEPRKYIIAYYEYASEMSNQLYIRATDKLDVALNYAARFGCEDFIEEIE